MGRPTVVSDPNIEWDDEANVIEYIDSAAMSCRGGPWYMKRGGGQTNRLSEAVVTAGISSEKNRYMLRRGIIQLVPVRIVRTDGFYRDDQR